MTGRQAHMLRDVEYDQSVGYGIAEGLITEGMQGDVTPHLNVSVTAVAILSDDSSLMSGFSFFT